MRFKSATIDVRFSRESGTDRFGRYAHGETYTTRYISNVYTGMPIDLIRSGLEVARLEIRADDDGSIDAEIWFNGQYVYSFVIDGIVKNEYTSVRYFFSGFYYILEYRFLERQNS